MLCGSPTHTIDKCPCIPSIPKIELIVKKLQAHNICDQKSPHKYSSSGDPEAKEKWIHVSPKNRGKPSSTPPNPRAHYGGIRISKPQPQHTTTGAKLDPPFSNDKGRVVLVKEEQNLAEPHLGKPILEGIPAAWAPPGSFPLLPHVLIPQLPSFTLFSSTTLKATQVLSPVSHLDRIISLTHEGSSSSQGFESAMDYEEEGNDLYLELDDLNDPVHSTNSSKKRKLEEGDEFSSHPFN